MHSVLTKHLLPSRVVLMRENMNALMIGLAMGIMIFLLVPALFGRF